jgi:hypothetical protein
VSALHKKVFRDWEGIKKAAQCRSYRDWFRDAGALFCRGFPALLPQHGQVASAFFAAISFRNAVNVCPQFLHNTSIVGSAMGLHPKLLCL